MKWKETIELPVSEPFKVVAKLRKVEGVLSANVIDVTRIVVSYDTRKIQGKVVAKLCRPVVGGRVEKRKTKRP